MQKEQSQLLLDNSSIYDTKFHSKAKEKRRMLLSRGEGGASEEFDLQVQSFPLKSKSRSNAPFGKQG